MVKFCSTCGGRITEPYHWVSIHKELEGQSYCSKDCVELATSKFDKQRHLKYVNNLINYTMDSMFYALELLSDYDLMGDLKEYYPNIEETLHSLKETLDKDSGKEKK